MSPSMLATVIDDLIDSRGASCVCSADDFLLTAKAKFEETFCGVTQRGLKKNKEIVLLGGAKHISRDNHKGPLF